MATTAAAASVPPPDMEQPLAPSPTLLQLPHTPPVPHAAPDLHHPTNPPPLPPSQQEPPGHQTVTLSPSTHIPNLLSLSTSPVLSNLLLLQQQQQPQQQPQRQPHNHTHQLQPTTHQHHQQHHADRPPPLQQSISHHTQATPRHDHVQTLPIQSPNLSLEPPPPPPPQQQDHHHHQHQHHHEPQPPSVTLPTTRPLPDIPTEPLGPWGNRLATTTTSTTVEDPDTNNNNNNNNTTTRPSVPRAVSLGSAVGLLSGAGSAARRAAATAAATFATAATSVPRSSLNNSTATASTTATASGRARTADPIPTLSSGPTQPTTQASHQNIPAFVPARGFTPRSPLRRHSAFSRSTRRPPPPDPSQTTPTNNVSASAAIADPARASTTSTPLPPPPSQSGVVLGPRTRARLPSLSFRSRRLMPAFADEIADWTPSSPSRPSLFLHNEVHVSRPHVIAPTRGLVPPSSEEPVTLDASTIHSTLGSPSTDLVSASSIEREPSIATSTSSIVEVVSLDDSRDQPLESATSATLPPPVDAVVGANASDSVSAQRRAVPSSFLAGAPFPRAASQTAIAERGRMLLARHGPATFSGTSHSVHSLMPHDYHHHHHHYIHHHHIHHHHHHLQQQQLYLLQHQLHHNHHQHRRRVLQDGNELNENSVPSVEESGDIRGTEGNRTRVLDLPGSMAGRSGPQYYHPYPRTFYRRLDPELIHEHDDPRTQAGPVHMYGQRVNSRGGHRQSRHQGSILSHAAETSQGQPQSSTVAPSALHGSPHEYVHRDMVIHSRSSETQGTSSAAPSRRRRLRLPERLAVMSFIGRYGGRLRRSGRGNVQMGPADASSEDDSLGYTYEELLGLEERNVRLGMSEADLAALPTRTAVKEHLQFVCHICLEGFDYGDIVAYLPCTHFYHKSCIQQWLVQKRTCPICRKDC